MYNIPRLDVFMMNMTRVHILQRRSEALEPFDYPERVLYSLFRAWMLLKTFTTILKECVQVVIANRIHKDVVAMVSGSVILFVCASKFNNVEMREFSHIRYFIFDQPPFTKCQVPSSGYGDSFPD